MSIETEQFRSPQVEREKNYESKESKEAELDPELKAAAAMERADYLTGEIKSSKKQIQNIVVHMSQVLQALKQLRAQLQLSEDGDHASLEQDNKRIEELKSKISEHKDELIKMKDELIVGYMNELQKQDATMGESALREKAEQAVDNVLNELEN